MVEILNNPEHCSTWLYISLIQGSVTILSRACFCGYMWFAAARDGFQVSMTPQPSHTGIGLDLEKSSRQSGRYSSDLPWVTLVVPLGQ